MSNPLISVIVPVYRVEKYLHNCINSVLNQSYTNWELILVNDGSPDDCPQICDEYAAKDSRVKVIHKQNGGLSDARNFGIKASSGEFLVFLDSDDYWDDILFLQGLKGLIIQNPNVDVINFGWKKYYPEENRFIEDSRDFSYSGHVESMKDETTCKMIKKDLYVACAWNKCVRANFLISNKLFFRKGIKSEDMEWCGDILYCIPSMICYNSKSYIYRQQRQDSITSTVDENHISDIIVQIKDALAKGENLEHVRKNIYLSFFALQYLTLLYNVYIKPKSTIDKFAQPVQELKGILNYDLNKKVYLANKFRMFLSFTLLKRVLTSYINYKKV